jgi:hypothetical protein
LTAVPPTQFFWDFWANTAEEEHLKEVLEELMVLRERFRGKQRVEPGLMDGG